jgi:hypothetical protein
MKTKPEKKNKHQINFYSKKIVCKVEKGKEVKKMLYYTTQNEVWEEGIIRK